jgi:hypothetical protein
VGSLGDPEIAGLRRVLDRAVEVRVRLPPAPDAQVDRDWAAKLAPLEHTN